MAPLSSKQPFKAIYIVCFLIKTAIIFAFLLTRFLFPRLRPVPGWSFKMSMSAAITRVFFNFTTNIRSRGFALEELAHKDERVVIVKPPDKRFFSGFLADNTVQPAAVPTIWCPKPFQPAEDARNQKVILHYPGGAFIFAFNPIQFYQNMQDAVSHMGAAKMCWAQYRLASSPSTRFPASIQDAVTYYHHLLHLGVSPRNIILSGESAGGNVVIALMRYLESQTELPLPAGAMLWSPWVDVNANSGHEWTRNENAKRDFLPSSMIQWGVDDYLPDGQIQRETMPYISPLHHPFKTKIPLFVQAGAVEGLLPSIKSFAREMAEVEGNRVRLHVTELAVHGMFLSYPGWGFQDQFKAAVLDAREFFEHSV
ncbi:Alpha/Beta hydrolase protein [Hypoxylon sp. FL1284]|nr:Alpha/Beta hydrolase protein [Hypoxylon sp. FL1284]